MRNTPPRAYMYLPIVLSVMLAGGVWLGARLQPQVATYAIDPGSGTISSRKINNLLNYVAQEYVDSLDMEGLTESAILSMLEQLDPHSAYIPARHLEAMNQPLQGNFDGIGVEFNIIADTIVVIAPISGGPSEKLGIRAGDRIVRIEGEGVAGTGIRNEDVISALRGERGTKVTVSIVRRGSPDPIDFTITRDKIPIYSVDAGFMLNKQAGYIKVSRFAATTYDEFKEKLAKLKKEGMTQLVLDLRGNPGGYLNAAISISDEFLPKGKLIVYTQGRARPRKDSHATAKGDFETQPIVILIDEGSASASEIVAGAVQDNDRGTIIGRRSFGKGLVQEQADLPDGSAVRLTIARYYTPTGRCIQKPYEHGGQYEDDFFQRLEQGELYEADSVKVDEEARYVTPGGKVVYGGGGIMPDIFVPLDTSEMSLLLNRLQGRGLLREFAIDLATQRKEALDRYRDAREFAGRFRLSDDDYAQIIAIAREKGIRAGAAEAAKARPGIERTVRALIARSRWNSEGYMRVMLEGDKAISEAIRAMGQGGAD